MKSVGLNMLIAFAFSITYLIISINVLTYFSSIVPMPERTWDNNKAITFIFLTAIGGSSFWYMVFIVLESLQGRAGIGFNKRRTTTQITYYEYVEENNTWEKLTTTESKRFERELIKKSSPHKRNNQRD